MPKLLKHPVLKLFFSKLLFVAAITSPLLVLNKYNEANAGIEFQWDNDSAYRRLKWYQTDAGKRARNTMYFFLRPSDRKTALLKIDMKFPRKFQTNLKTEKINLCKVNIGGFNSRTKCLENIKADFEINKDGEKTTLSIYPFSPLPSSKDSYAVVFKIFNPRRSGLYQFHSYGQSAGKIPVSTYIGSWTLVID